MNLRSTIDARLGWKWVNGAVDEDNLTFKEVLANGFDDNEAEIVWHLEDEALVNGASTTWDLTALTRDILGDDHESTLGSVKAILVISASTSVGTLIVGAADYDVWWAPFDSETGTVEVPPDSPLLLVNRQGGWEVTKELSSSSSSGESGADRMLKVTASGGAVTYSIAIIGTQWSSSGA